ncbi:MAG: FtsX-like permease family protein [Gammaproteobacteria bacterium]|nr:FtsX-like permease family protein [Gammaproteobacteria bacterium]
MWRQIVEITLMNLRNIPSRLGASSVIVVGIAGVVGVLVALLSMAVGFRSALENTGAPERAIVLRGGAGGELSSGIANEHVAIVASMDGIAQASAELFTIADVPKRSSGTPANLVVRGVEPSAFAIRPELQIVSGRNFDTGKNELIAGVGAAAEFQGIDLGATIAFRDSSWTIVGLFEAGSGVNESEVWTDLPTAQAAFRREGAVTSMRVRLTSPETASELATTIENDPRLDLELIAEPTYYSTQAKQLTSLITGFGYVVATIMAIGAVFAALNTMYSAVSTRTVEIATLRAIGFSSAPVVVSVMFEALILATLGGLAGAAAAYLAFNGNTISTLSGFSQVAFDFTVTPALVTTGVVWAVSLGAVGGLFPAVRAARLPITVALRGE